MLPDHNINIIEIKNLNFSYGDKSIIKDVSFNIHRGDYIGIIGPNGGGKTTLVKLILGLLKPDSGSVSLFGEPCAKFKNWPKIGYVAQKVTNFDSKFPATVNEVVSMGRFSQRGLLKSLNKTDKSQVSQALQEVEMSEYKNRLIGNLSGGQQQRVFIARALAQQPEIIFLDEPTSGVDLASQEKFYELLKKLNSKLNITLVLISHDIDAITKEVTEIVCINQSLIFYGLAKEFLKEEHSEKLYSKGIKFIHH